ncbi:hypothetical protein [Helicobacter sp. 11S02596-1]|uniref:hypothetical protein n=1 Tax=Helicobacter sp. 11S02596-1 TaxID=1476194 RepID=UPI000BA6765B|nr:hypothetical protein [Helicobacter sp. 11S02596-1]PAF41372.1 hypothetical protein BJI48_08760 [Helicobacter sp. 11S02596-1]
MSNRPSHYNKGNKVPKEKTPCYTLSKEFIELLQAVSQYEHQTPSRVLEASINYFFCEGIANEYQKIKKAQKCYKKPKALSVAKNKNKKNQTPLQKTPNDAKLFD